MTFVMGGNSHAGSRKFWILCSSQEEFPKISFLLSFLSFFFFCFHPISHLLHWPVSVHKAPAPSPRQTPQAAQLQQEPQQEGTATGEVLELSNINHRMILYDLPPRVIEIKAKINKWDLIKLRCWEPAWEFPPMTKVMRRGLI